MKPRNQKIVALCLCLFLCLFWVPIGASAEGQTHVVGLYAPDPDGAMVAYQFIDVEDGACLEEYLPMPVLDDQPGLQFQGWCLRGETMPFSWQEPICESFDLYAQWTEVFTVTFHWNDGSEESESLEYAENDFLEPPELPQPEGWELMGWNTQADGTGFNLEDCLVDRNMDFYAQWGRIFSAHFQLGEEEYTITEVVPADQWDITLPQQEKEGHTLSGWTTRPDGSGDLHQPGETYSVNWENPEVTFYAQWEPIVCTVTFQGLETRACLWGNCCQELPSPEVDDQGCAVMEDGLLYRFAGWFTGEQGAGQEFNIETPVEGDMILYPRWVRQVPVTFVVENGTWQENGESSLTVLLDADTLLDDWIPTPEPAPHFKAEGHWDSDPTGQPAGDHTYHFSCSPLELFAFYLEGMEPVMVEEGSRADLPQPERPGWEFAGWYREDGSRWHSDALACQEEHLHPGWEKTLSLSFDSTGGEGGPQTITHTVTQEDQLPVQVTVPREKPKRTGYSFLGWAWDPLTQEPVVQPGEQVALEADKTLYALWKMDTRKITLTYHANQGTAPPESQTWEGAAESYRFTVSYQVPIREGYTFMGWGYSKQDQENLLHGGDGCTVTEKTTLYAIWKKLPPSCKVSFYSQGSQVTQVYLEQGTSLGSQMPQPPQREGYEFMGWNTRPDGTGEMVSGQTVIDHSIALYGQWEQQPTEVIIRFFDRQVELPARKLQPGQPLGDLPQPEPRQGYQFQGWNTEADGTGIQLTGQTLAQQPLTAYAQWAKVTRGTLEFWNGEEKYHSCTLDLGSAIGENLPKEPHRSGYRFLGWNTRADGTGKKLYPSTILREDMAVYARWEKIAYATVTFLSRGQVVEEVTVEQGKRLGDAMPDNPSRNGYSFKGWNLEPGGEGERFYKSTAVHQDMEVYARWAIRDRRNPKTGDGILAWLLLMGLSGGALAAMKKYNR